MAGESKGSKSGRTALRSYGSISYAGMLSYAYANLKKDDSRVTAVRKWLTDNYTLEENPGMGAQGHHRSAVCATLAHARTRNRGGAVTRRERRGAMRGGTRGETMGVRRSQTTGG